MARRAMWWLLAGVVAAGGAGCTSSGVSTASSRSDGERLKNEKAKAEMIQDRPLTADSHFAAGQLAETQNDLPKAVEQYQAALKLNPKHVEALYRLALINTAQQQFGQAIELWTRYTDATGKSAAGYSNLGLCYELAGRSQDAESTYRAGIARDSNDPACRVNYGLMLARHERLDEAVAQLQTVLTPAEVHYNLASVFESEGRTAKAKEEYLASLKIDPNMSDAKARLASLGSE